MSSLTSSKTVRHCPSHMAQVLTRPDLWDPAMCFHTFVLAAHRQRALSRKDISMGALSPAMIALKPGIKLDFRK